MELNIGDLKEWTVENNIENRTIEGCLEYFNNYKIEEPEEMFEYFGEFDSNLINIRFWKIGMFLSNRPTKDYSYIASYAKIDYNNKSMGLYKLIFNFGGYLRLQRALPKKMIIVILIMIDIIIAYSLFKFGI